MTFSSRLIQRSSPGVPFWYCRGARFVAEAKALLPRPPRPPTGAAARGAARLAGGDQVAQDVAALAVVQEGARWHVDDQIFGLAAVAVGGLSAAAVVGPPVFAIDDLGEAVGAGDGADDD